MGSKRGDALYAQTNIFLKQSMYKSYKCLLHPLRHGRKFATTCCTAMKSRLLIRLSLRRLTLAGHGETRRRLLPMNCVFDQLSRISFPFTRLIKLIRHGSCVTIPFYLKQFNMFSIFNNKIYI